MKYISVSEIAQKWNISERTVRNYCAMGRIEGAFLTGKTWNIPENAIKPSRINKSTFSDNQLLKVLKEQKDMKLKGGIYHRLQVDMTYNSNHIEGSRLTENQTHFIFETNTIGAGDEDINIDDIIETINHFKCVDFVIDNAKATLKESFIKELHFMLKSGSSDGNKTWFNVGEYKKLPNEVGGNPTTLPSDVPAAIKKLLVDYNGKQQITFEDIVGFHHDFESIHPFQDGNGRVGRLIMLKECLRHNIVPFIVQDNAKWYYYRGLKEWPSQRGYLLDTCLSFQNKFKELLTYFGIAVE